MRQALWRVLALPVGILLAVTPLRAIRYFAGFRATSGRAWLLAIVRNTCRGAPRLAPSARDGYQIERRVVAGMECWAVSDLNATELREFLERYAQHFAPGH
jgi:DNA-directed RNA polymerase specialized sigma24 family protein